LSNTIMPPPVPAPATPVGIPNVAQQTNLRVNKRIAVLGGIGLLVFLGAAGTAYWKVQEYFAQREALQREQDAVKSAAATGQARKFRSEAPPPAAVPASAPPPAYKVPDVDPNASDAIKVVGAGQRTGSGTAMPKLDPRDAPMLLAPSRGRGTAIAAQPGAGGEAVQPQGQLQQLQQQREQLQGMLTNLQRMNGMPAQAGGFLRTAMPMGPQGGMPVQQQPTPQQEALAERQPLVAGQIADMSLTLAEGDGFTCSLSVEVVSNVAGRMKCVTQQDVRGADQRVVLAEKGTILTGEYGVTNIRPGTRAIEAQWTRLRTPYGITVPLRWNAIGQLGASGIDGHVNNRWGERISAALLLALIDDAVKIVIADKQSGTGGGDTNIVLGGTAQTGSRMAEKVLDSTINIPPTISRNHGTIVGVDVMRDVDFSRVYALRPAAR
jgi:type IV secretion system protein VirB10